MTTSKAAAERLAKGIEPGDFVLYGDRTVKMRVPVEGLASGQTHSKTHVRPMGEVVEVTPTGRLRVIWRDSDKAWTPRLLSAKDSLRADKMDGGMLARRKTMLLGWE